MSNCFNLYLSFPVDHDLWVPPTTPNLYNRGGSDVWSQGQQHRIKTAPSLSEVHILSLHPPTPRLLNQKLGYMLQLENHCQISASDLNLKGSNPVPELLRVYMCPCSWRNCAHVFRIPSSLTPGSLRHSSSFKCLYNIASCTVFNLCIFVLLLNIKNSLKWKSLCVHH